MRRIAAIFMIPLALLLALGEAQAADPQKWSIMIFRTNLNAFDDAQQQKAFDRVKERTKGQLDIKTAFSGSLPIKNSEWFRAVSKGDLDGCVIVGDYHAGDFPLLGLIQTPFLFQSQVEKNLANIAVFPLLQREANKLGVQLLVNRPFGETGFWTTDPVEDITDMGGRKLRAQAKHYSLMAEAIKGVPVPVAWAEAYTALQRGLVKGIFTGYDSVTGAKIHEVAPYGHRIYLANGHAYIGVNKKNWDALSADVQAIVYEELGRAMQVIQANVPKIINDEIGKQLASGLKKWNPQPPKAWLDVMQEKIAKPMLKDEMKKAGPVGEEMVSLIEKAIGRKVR